MLAAWTTTCTLQLSLCCFLLFTCRCHWPLIQQVTNNNGVCASDCFSSSFTCTCQHDLSQSLYSQLSLSPILITVILCALHQGHIKQPVYVSLDCSNQDLGAGQTCTQVPFRHSNVSFLLFLSGIIDSLNRNPNIYLSSCGVTPDSDRNKKTKWNKSKSNRITLKTI